MATSVAVLGAASLLLPQTAIARPSGSRATTTTTTAPSVEERVQRRASDPDRTIVTTTDGRWLATFTDGSRTVLVAGPQRTFAEAEVEATVVHSQWVRLLATPFAGVVDDAWLDGALVDRSPDVLGVALQFVAGARAVSSGGLRIAGDADYGPLQSDGSRQEGSDWNDYQQVTATYGDVVDRPEAEQARSLDCSGFVRMVFGRRLGVPMGLAVDSGSSLPRRSFEQYAAGPGTVLLPATGERPGDLAALTPGDLLFFDVSTDDGTRIDHVAIYLGVDGDGLHRFVSSRKSINGPTMGDYGGRSVLDGSGLYATGFRAARRI